MNQRTARSITAATLMALAAVSLSACSHGSTSAPSAPVGTSAPVVKESAVRSAETPEAAVKAFLIAADMGRYDEACAWLTVPAQQDITANMGGDCVSALPKALSWFDFDDDGIGAHSDTSLWTTETSLQKSGIRAEVHVVLHHAGDALAVMADKTAAGWQVSTLDSQRD